MKQMFILFFTVFYIYSIDETSRLDKIPSIKSRNLNATLLIAIQEGDLALVKYMLEHGADIAYQNYRPLTLAIELGNDEIVHICIDAYLSKWALK